MAILKKKTTEDFRVPSLAESSLEYAAQLAKRDELNAKQQDLHAQIRDIEGQLKRASETPGERLSKGVAALLGDEPDSAFGLRQQVAELRRQLGEVEAATEIIARRISVAKAPASGLVVAACRDEYKKRVAAVAKAAAGLHEARMSYLDLRWQFEAEDIQWTSLGPISIGFLGDHTDGPLIALSKVAGNV